MKYLVLALLLFIGSMQAVQARVIINEIGAYEPSNTEWIEIYNTSSSPIRLDEWIFWENNANHRLTLVQGTSTLRSNEYAIITQNDNAFFEKYPNVTNTVFDSAWGSLKESGEELGLKNEAGEFVDAFIYPPAPETSLERVSSSTHHWQEHPSSHSIGKRNHIYTSVDEIASTSDQSVTTTSDHIETEDDSTGFSILVYPYRSVIINEIVSDPDDKEDEFVELYNATNKYIDLRGWTLYDGSEKRTALPNGVQSNGFYVVSNPLGKLNNSGDRIVLRDATGHLIDQLSYGNWDDGRPDDNLPVAKDPFSLARTASGTYEITRTVTKGSKNVIHPTSIPYSKPESIQTPRILGKKIKDASALPTVSSTTSTHNCTSTPLKATRTVTEVDKVRRSPILRKTLPTKTYTTASAQPLDQASVGKYLTTEGVVVSTPGELGSQYMYIMSTTTASGIQVYSHKKLFPTLTHGDYVKVSGIVSEAYGEKRIKTSSANHIQKIHHILEIQPVPLNAQTTSTGLLARISGTVIDKKDRHLFIESDGQEYIVDLKHINASTIGLSDTIEHIEITGITRSYQSNIVLVPRTDSDIAITYVALLSEDIEGVNIQSQSNHKPLLYGTLFASGMYAIATGRNKVKQKSRTKSC